jgi:DNA-binding transcriptional LysR family regulator
MNLSHLTTFLHVASTGSLTTTARALSLTQPAVSHHIKSLEEALGICLFIRHKNGMRLTAEGEDLCAASRTVMHAADDISFQVQCLNSLKRGRVVIALTSFIGSALVQALPTFKQEYPHVRVDLLFNNTDNVLDAVKENRADIGFAVGKTAPNSPVTGMRIHKERILLLAPTGHSLCRLTTVVPQDVRDHLFVSREQGTFTRQFTAAWFADTPMPANTVETTRSSSVRELILAGAVGLAPENVVSRDIEEGKIRVLPAEGLQSWVNCNLYVSRSHPLKKAARAFLHTLSLKRCFSHAADLPGWLQALP